MHFIHRRICFTVAGILFGAGTSHAQSDKIASRQVAVLHAQAAKIDRNLARYRNVKRDLPGRSTEGGTLTFYSAGSSPRKLYAQYFGESGQATEAFYFRGNRLFLMRRLNSTYDKLYGKVVATYPSEFYFRNGKLIGGSSKDATPQRGREILTDARDLLQMAKTEK